MAQFPFCPSAARRKQCRSRLEEHYGASLSRYEQMVLETEKHIPTYYFVLAGFFSWLLLAGFLVSPSTFASVRDMKALDETGYLGRSVKAAIQNFPLFIIAAFGCFIASCGMTALWYIWRHNYVWVCRCLVMYVDAILGVKDSDHFLRPAVIQSFTGLISTFLNVYAVKGGYWSVGAYVSVGIIGGSFAFSTGLFVLYSCILVPKLDESSQR